MDVIDLILLIIAAVCFAATALNATARVNLLGVGLLAWVLVPLIDAVQALD